MQQDQVEPLCQSHLSPHAAFMRPGPAKLAQFACILPAYEAGPHPVAINHPSTGKIKQALSLPWPVLKNTLV